MKIITDPKNSNLTGDIILRNGRLYVMTRTVGDIPGQFNYRWRRARWHEVIQADK